ncbi:TPA: hypothetical protein ACNZ88_005180, partial [Enterobacter kobei]
MKTQNITFVCVAIIFSYQVETTAREYNVWYTRDGVLYGLTQTSDSRPVQISISSHGLEEVGMVITFQDKLPCNDDVKNPLKIDSINVKYKIICASLDRGYIKSYTITDPNIINYVLNRLRS